MPQTTGGGSSISKPRARKYVKRSMGGEKSNPKVAARSSAVMQSKTPMAKAGAAAALSSYKPKGKNAAAKRTVRRVTRAAVRKGISGPTEDSLGITRQEGGRKIRKAIKTLGYDKAAKVSSKTRLRQGQTYKGGKGWVSKPTRTAPRARRKAY